MLLRSIGSKTARGGRSFSSRAAAAAGVGLGGEGEKMRMIILGAPGAGKGTLGERLLKKWDISTVGVGDLLRAEITKGSELGKHAKGVMKAGGLLPDEIVLKLVEPELSSLQNKNWILDGFPRKASQAILLDQLLASHHTALNLVIYLDVPDEVIMSRIEDRWIHVKSGRVYNVQFNPPKIEGIDDITGEALIRRNDDTPEIFQTRLSSFHHENIPLLSHYASSSLSTSKSILVKLSGTSSDEIFPMLEKVVGERFPGLSERL